MTADELRQKLEEWGIDGETPASRIEQFKHLSTEGIAIVIDEINKSLQGSQDSLMNHETAVKIGTQETLKPEFRYDVFKQLIDDIRQCPDTVNPARIGDVLALGVVL